MSFGRKTYSALARILPRHGHSGLTALFHQYAVEGLDAGSNLQSRAVALARAIENGSSTEGTIEEVTVSLIENTLLYVDLSSDEGSRLSAALASDGYALVDNRVAPVLPVAVNAPLQPSNIETVLSNSGATEALNHYQQAIATFADARYEAANSQCRSALESFLRYAAATRGKNTSDPIASIQALGASRLLSDKEQAYLKAAWSLMHEGGSHAGSSSGTEALFRLTTTSLAVWFLSERISDRAP